MSSEDQILTFKAITSVEDDSTASHYLEMSGGVLDIAVSLYFEHGATAAPSVSAAGNGVSAIDDEEYASGLQNEAYQEQQDEIRAPIQSSVQRLVDNGPSFYDTISAAPEPSARAFMSNLPTGIFNQNFGYDPRQQETFYSGRFNRSQHNVEDDDDDDEDYNIEEDEGYNENDHYSDEELVQETDSEGDITYTRRRVIRRRPNSNSRVPQQTPHQRRLAELFSPPWDIISKYDLNMAKSVGRQTKKWIIVNVQDNSDFRCQQLNRDLWSNTGVKDVIKENFIFLQYPKDSAMGTDYISYYPFSDYPHIAILDPKTGERVKMWSEVPEPRKFIEQLVDFLDRFSLEPGHLNPIVQHKKKIDPASLTEEQQMELAIKKSLGAAVDDEDGVIENGDNDKNPIVLDSDEVDDEFSNFEEISDDDDDDDDGEEPESVDNDVAEVTEITEKVSEPPKEENLEDLTDEEVFATIIPRAITEPENDPQTTTRIQIRSGDGSRVVRRFNKTDLVKDVYAYIKNDFESVAGGKFFTLTSQRANLVRKIKETIEEAGLLNAAILLEVDDN